MKLKEFTDTFSTCVDSHIILFNFDTDITIVKKDTEEEISIDSAEFDITENKLKLYIKEEG